MAALSRIIQTWLTSGPAGLTAVPDAATHSAELGAVGAGAAPSGQGPSQPTALAGGEGVLLGDAVSFARSATAISANLGRHLFADHGGQGVHLSLPANVTQIIGTPFNDTILGDGRGDVIAGLGGNDVLIAGPHATFEPGAGNDVVIGVGTGNTVSYFSEGPVAVDLSHNVAHDGSGGIDRLLGIQNVVGSPHGDTIVGNVLDNRILGGFGADRLTGGGGHDTFIYTDRFDFGDHITDFQTGIDTIEVSRGNIWVGTPPPAGRLANADLTVTTHPADAHSHFAFNPDSHVLYANVGGGFAPLPMLTLDHGTLHAHDILIA